ncbi:DUF2569 domain-containing protein [Anaeromicrobium sediminis]|uniref:DUF2569 domain-containing protein n=1 Tax=Anaeromicrobium sediminis TaxID=1478221 RepID=A0A267MP10_9FIRM|nr:DUF2569 domain-containing protein [Anaeromicrobium sediminis]PAB61334.1 hypothetical protein CCE28_02570 [Anaeromicrobium sediminis]
MRDNNVIDESIIEEDPGKKKEPLAIGGWLVLPSIGVITNPFRTVYGTYSMFMNIFQSGQWDQIASSNSAFYDQSLKNILVFELVSNVLMIILSIFLLYLFIRKSKHFPKSWIAFVSINALILTVDLVLCRKFVTNAPGAGDLFMTLARSLFALVVWGTYLMKSKRVKNTFIK